MIDWIIDRLDMGTTKLQRCGWLLTDIHVYNAGIAFVCSVSETALMGHYWWLPFSGGVWGAMLWANIRWAERNKDYPNSSRMMNNLNSKALWHRQKDRWFYHVWLFFFCFFVPIEISRLISGNFLAIIAIIGIFAMPLTCYLCACTFIGPGEFAKDTKEVVSHNMVLDR